MDFFSDVMLSRLQFALTTAFHIMWASFSIGLAVYLVMMEGLWLKTKDEDYLRHAKFWGRFFLLIFAVGVVSGIPLSFQFGTNWQPFSSAAGGFFGSLLSFEAVMAFMLEAAFLGVMVFGWNRVGPRMHFFSTVMVAFGSSLSAWWIMVANSWMQTPAGGHMENGRFVVTSYFEAVFNPDALLGFGHMWVACLETAFFAVAGLSAWYILKGRHRQFFYKSFRTAVFAVVGVSVLQFLLGDMSGRMIAVHQPTKLAATEAHWETNPPGEGAGWNALAWINEEEGKNDFEINLPYALSLLITHSFTGQVQGLNEFPKEDHPPVWITFYSFRVMMAIGFGLIFLSLFTVWLWFRKKMGPEELPGRKNLLRLWVLTIPLGYVAIVTGWITREVGRQPWTIFGIQRTSDAATRLPASAVGFSILVYGAIYTALFLAALFVARRIVISGPGLEPEAPADPPEDKAEEGRA